MSAYFPAYKYFGCSIPAIQAGRDQSFVIARVILSARVSCLTLDEIPR